MLRSNFEHGDTVMVSKGPRGALLRVHAPRWFEVAAHLRWVLARLRGDTHRLTLTDGSTLRLVRVRP